MDQATAALLGAAVGGVVSGGLVLLSSWRTDRRQERMTRLNNELALEQKRWDLRRKAYTHLLERLGEFVVNMDAVKEDLSRPAGEPPHSDLEEYSSQAMAAYKDVVRVSFTAALFLNPQAREALHAMRERWSKANRLRDERRIAEDLTAAARTTYTALVAAGGDDLVGLRGPAPDI